MPRGASEIADGVGSCVVNVNSAVRNTRVPTKSKTPSEGGRFLMGLFGFKDVDEDGVGEEFCAEAGEFHGE